MRILFATDGSASADRARDLLAGLPLPAGSYIHVAGVRHDSQRQFGEGWPLVAGEAAALAGAEVRTSPLAVAAPPPEDHLAVILDATVSSLEAPGRRVDRVMLDGRPGPAIVEEARDMVADLIVVGNRGHGTIESMLLGSVSRAVVGHAPCSTLVVRGTKIESVLFATDGSDDARRAERAVATWPMFSGTKIRVVSVAQTAIPTAIGGVPALYDQVVEQYAEDVERARLSAREEARSAAERLNAVGYKAVAEEREGDPAGEIVRAAATGADLVVTGTHGRTGLSRLFLGSVAENVAGHAPCSVLVVREATR